MELWQNVAFTLLPFLIVLLIVGLIYPGIPLPKLRNVRAGRTQEETL